MLSVTAEQLIELFQPWDVGEEGGGLCNDLAQSACIKGESAASYKCFQGAVLICDPPGGVRFTRVSRVLQQVPERIAGSRMDEEHHPHEDHIVICDLRLVGKG